MTANVLRVKAVDAVFLRALLGFDLFNILLTCFRKPTSQKNPSPLDDPTQSKEWEKANNRQQYAEKESEYELLKQKEEKGEVLTDEQVMKIQKFEDAKERERQRDADKFGWGIDYHYLEPHQQANRDEKASKKRAKRASQKPAKRETFGAKRASKKPAKREKLGAKREKECYTSFQPDSSSNRIYFKESNTEQQVNCEDQPYYEQDWFTKYFGIMLVRALRSYNKFEGNLSYITRENLIALYEHIRMVENIRKAYIYNRQSLLDSLQNCSKKEDLNLYFNNEVILTILPGTKLGLTIRKDNELGGVSITQVKEACEFKDLVGIGWRITSIDNVPVTSKDDFKAKDPNRHRVMRFVKPQS